MSTTGMKHEIQINILTRNLKIKKCKQFLFRSFFSLNMRSETNFSSKIITATEIMSVDPFGSSTLCSVQVNEMNSINIHKFSPTIFLRESVLKIRFIYFKQLQNIFKVLV